MARTRQALDTAFMNFVINSSDTTLIHHGVTCDLHTWRSSARSMISSWSASNEDDFDGRINEWLVIHFTEASIRVLRQRYSAWKHRQKKQLTSISIKTTLKERLLKEAEKQGLDSIDGVIEFLLDDK